MDFLQFFDLILHVDKYLGDVINHYGAFAYVLLCAIVYCETGIVVCFFLPGDTLLFIGGAFCAGGEMHVSLLAPLLMLAAIGGSTANYWIGSMLGHRVFTQKYRWLDRNALIKTHAFYEKYGGMTMVLSRCIPVVRTFAPFLAGVSAMTWGKFQTYNISGAVLWVILLVSCGYFFGNIPAFRGHLNAIVLFGVAVATLPAVFHGLWILAKKIFRK